MPGKRGFTGKGADMLSAREMPVAVGLHLAMICGRFLAWLASCVVAFATVVAAPLASAQIADPNTDFDQWAGPYTLAALDVGPGGGTLLTGEIAHAAVLPPPTDHADSQRVVFFVRQLESTQFCATNVYGRSWLWNPDRPSNAVLLPITPAAA